MLLKIENILFKLNFIMYSPSPLVNKCRTVAVNHKSGGKIGHLKAVTIVPEQELVP